MPHYAYRAVDVMGRIERGTLLAAHESDLSGVLRARRLELIEARPRSFAAGGGLRLWLYGRSVIQPWQRIALFEQLSDILGAGLSLAQALDTLRKAQPEGGLRNAVATIAQALQQGQRLAAAAAQCPLLCDETTVAIIASGEASGELAATFARLAQHHRQRQINSERLQRLIRYPAFLLLLVLAVTSFLMMAVIPEVIRFLDLHGGDMPPLTRALVVVAGLGSVLWPWVLTVFFLSAVAFTVLRRLSAPFLMVCDQAVLRLPYLRHLVMEAERLRFIDNLSTLYAQRLDILQALRLSRGVVRNHVLRQRLSVVMDRVRAGASVAAALDGWLPASATAILVAGEGAGLLEKSLSDVAYVLGRDHAARVDRFLARLEPVLTILMGLFLAWIIMAVLQPLYGSLTQMKVMG